MRFYSTFKIPAKYDRDTSSTKLKDISRQLSASLLGVWCNKRPLVDRSGMINLRWRPTIDQKMATFAWDALYDTTPNSNSNQYPCPCRIGILWFLEFWNNCLTCVVRMQAYKFLHTVKFEIRTFSGVEDVVCVVFWFVTPSCSVGGYRDLEQRAPCPYHLSSSA
jgi:hypothetical protein